MKEFAEKVAVITGAGSGIGRGLARKAAREQMKVVLADIEDAALADATTEIARLGTETLAVRTDVSNRDAVEALAAAAYDRFGAVHLVCLNAGVFQAGVSWQRTEADWAWVLGVNLWGPIHGVRAFVPRLIEQGGPAHLVITASMAGLMTVAYSGPYVVSKFAAAALAECVAHDLRAQGSEVGVSCLVPGSVDTKIADSTRNRPDEPPSEAQAPDHHLVAQALRDMTSTQGRPPDEVADIVDDDAIRARYRSRAGQLDDLARDRLDVVDDAAAPDARRADPETDRGARLNAVQRDLHAADGADAELVGVGAQHQQRVAEGIGHRRHRWRRRRRRDRIGASDREKRRSENHPKNPLHLSLVYDTVGPKTNPSPTAMAMASAHPTPQTTTARAVLL